MGAMSYLQGIVQSMTTDTNQWGTDCIFVSVDGLSEVECSAIVIRHASQVDDFGNIIRGATARCTVSEQALIDVSFPTRNDNDKIAMLGVKVSYTDVMGVTNTYQVIDQYAGQTVGIIKLILGEYSE
jgi:hypothetical protein